MNISKKLIPIALLLAVCLCFSSCNRGVGCPNNFSISKVVAKTVSSLPIAILK